MRVSLHDVCHLGLKHQASVIELFGAGVGQVIFMFFSDGGDAEWAAVPHIYPISEAIAAEGFEAAG